MCGIAGAIKLSGIGGKEIIEIKESNRIQKHRGPDDEGLFHDESAVLGHVRLSIIDLSSAGHQPFLSEDGRFVMVYNGEIYNYIELRDELEKSGRKFRTRTDTEVLLACYLTYGPECLGKLNGMFAFAVYDRQTRSLFAARDRFGVKPFYYRIFGNSFYFASEIKALRSAGSQALHADPGAMLDFLCFNRTDVSGDTFLAEIKRLPKGHWGVFDSRGWRMAKWWGPDAFLGKSEGISEQEACRRVEELMVSSVKLRMRSDVPVGSCLSGGLDSSILLGIVSEHCSPENYETFTAAFPGYRLDETRYIDLLRRRYAFGNRRTYPTADKAFADFKEFVRLADEPVTSPTFYSQFEVMRLAREHGITVLLDGQGGDENFAGYQYFHGFNFTGLYREKAYSRLLTEIAKSIIRHQDIEAFQTFAFQTVPGGLKKALLARRLRHIRKEFFYSMVENSEIYTGFFTVRSLNESIAAHFKYKLEHLLRAEDRNSMAFGLEARLPYLDYRLVEFMLGVPAILKIRQGENKRIQKLALGRYTIPEITQRQDKIGFGTPGEEWMRTPAWQELTEKNYRYLCEAMPDIFIGGAVLKYDLYERWKINQLAEWHRQVFG